MGGILLQGKQHRLEHPNSRLPQISYTSLSELFNLFNTQNPYLSNGVGQVSSRKLLAGVPLSWKTF